MEEVQLVLHGSGGSAARRAGGRRAVAARRQQGGAARERDGDRAAHERATTDALRERLRREDPQAAFIILLRHVTFLSLLDELPGHGGRLVARGVGQDDVGLFRAEHVRVLWIP